MAFVKLSDVSVTRVNSKGFGVQVKEPDRGEFKGAKFTLWFKEPHGLTVGDSVSVSGFLGAKVNEWEDEKGLTRHTVELAVNSPKLDGFPAKSEPEDAYPGSSEVPF